MRSGYYNQKDLHYGISRTRLRKILELAGDPKGKRILDIGCAGGYLGGQFKKSGNYVAGVEISDKAAEEARKILDKVYVFNIEKKWPEELNGEKFHLVILAEVLEHTFNPVKVLEAVGPVLAGGGKIIITTPNFLNWTNRLKMLFGFFRYTDQGLLDFGHIRFFTYDYLKRVLAETSFKITRENHILFPGKLTRILKFWPSLFATQFIVKAVKIL